MHIAERQKAVKGLKFGNRQNNIDHTISTEVGYDSEPIILSESSRDIDNSVQHNVADCPP